MSKPVADKQAVIWTDAAHLNLVERVLGRLPALSVAAIGGPRKGDLSDLASRFGLDSPEDDLRQMVSNRGDADLLLATQQGVKLDDVRMALEGSIDVLTLEPITIQADRAILQDRGATSAGRLMLAPMLRYAPGYLASAQPQEALGRVESVGLTSMGRAEEASLFARLVDAMDIAVTWLGVPVTINAALTGPLAEPPDDLRGLTGHLALNMHFADNVAMAAQLSDRAPVHRRMLTVIGQEGTLLLDDLHYRLYTASGRPLEATEHNDGQTAEPVEPASLIADQWRQMLKHRLAPPQPDPRVILGCCETVLLSARTGQSESTQTLVRMKL